MPRTDSLWSDTPINANGYAIDQAMDCQKFLVQALDGMNDAIRSDEPFEWLEMVDKDICRAAKAFKQLCEVLKQKAEAA